MVYFDILDFLFVLLKNLSAMDAAVIAPVSLKFFYIFFCSFSAISAQTFFRELNVTLIIFSHLASLFPIFCAKKTRAENKFYPLCLVFVYILSSLFMLSDVLPLLFFAFFLLSFPLNNEICYQHQCNNYRQPYKIADTQECRADVA